MDKIEVVVEYFIHMGAAMVEYIDWIPGSSLVIHYIKESYQNDPFRILLEGLLIIFTIRYLTSKKYRLNGDFIPLSKDEIETLIEEWEPEPLVPKETNSASASLNVKFMFETAGPAGLHVAVKKGQDGQLLKAYNLTAFNFLGFANAEKMKSTAIEALHKYGVGTCGPPGFYGTLDIHLTLEERLAELLQKEAAIIYSQNFSAISSVIPAFSKRGDILVVDGGIHFALQKGVQISRSHVFYFKHNDMKDARRVLQHVETLYAKRSLSRRFLVVEGLYLNYGDICPLGELYKLKKEFKYRIICDETLSFGIIGETGRGIQEQFGLLGTPDAIDIITGSLSHTFASCGGFCAGSLLAIEHQRLSGQGYCFSASLPALLTSAALFSLAELGSKGKELVYKLKMNVCQFHESLKPIHDFLLIRAENTSDMLLPLIHLELRHPLSSLDKEAELLQEIVNEGIERGLFLTRAKYVESQEKPPIPRPSLRLVISAGLSKTEIQAIGIKFAQTVRHVMQKPVSSLVSP